MNDDDDNKREEEENEAKEMEQMQLALQGEKFYIDYSALPFQYTGERFKARRPHDYKLAVKLIAMNQFSDYAIAKFVNVEPRVIAQIRINEIKDVEEQRALVKQKAFLNMMVLGDKVTELADKAQKPAEAAIPMGIMKDIYLQVSGQPSATVRVDHHFDFHGAIEALKREAEETMKRVKGHVIDPPALPEGEAA